MAANDTFPVDPDYTVTRSKEANVLRGRVESAREYFRQKAAPRRIFWLVFNRRAKADWDAIENFRLALLTDFFTFHDKTAGRKYSVRFDGEPLYEESGNEEHTIRVQLIEAVGAAMQAYPDFSGAYPAANLPVSQALDLGASGKVFVYAGYGYRVNGSFTSVYLDEADTGGANPNLPVALGLHRVRVVGGAPTSLDYLL